MGDPVGIIGTAAGLVSLGLQVYGGIKDYIDAIQGRQEELTSINRQVIGLKGALTSIERAIQNGTVKTQAAASSVLFCLQTCEAELNSLNAILSEVATSSSTPGISVLKAKFTEEKKKFVYPFKRSHIAKLDERLRHANSTLHTALQSLGINLLASIHDSVSVVKGQSDAIATGVTSLHSGMIDINTSINTMNQSLPTIMDGVQSLVPLIETETRSISGQFLQDGRILRQNLSHLGNQMETSFTSQRSQLDRIEAHLSQRVENEQLKRIEEILAGLELTEPPGRNHDSTARYLGRLVAKPGNLKALCDEFGVQKSVSDSFSTLTGQPESFAVPTRKRTRGICSCSKKHKRRYNRWGSLLMYHEEQTAHSSDCDCATFNEPENSLTVGATYFGSGTLLRRAIGITFSMKHGAGGGSMCAELVYYNVVDSRAAPVFRLMAALRTALNPIESDLRVSDLSKLLNECSTRIRELYLTGKAGPTDLTPSGKSVMHTASSLIEDVGEWCAHEASFKSLRDFIYDLLSYRVPANTQDVKGRTPLIRGLTLVEGKTSQAQCVEIWDLLYNSGADLPINDFDQASHLAILVVLGKFESLLRLSRVAAEVLGCNSLGLAILQRNLNNMKILIDADPSLCHEPNAFHMTPVHLACNWPNGLVELLQASSLPPVDPGYDSPLKLSTKYSSKICIEGGASVLCSGCSCYKCTEMLLQYDCNLWDEDIGNLMRNASFRTKITLLEELARRRARLREFALARLSKESCTSIGLKSMHLPDSIANQIVALLDRGGFEVPEPLRTAPVNPRVIYWGSVYHHIDCPATADVLLGLGFKDFDSKDSSGRTPLSMARSPQYALWLIDHGADIIDPSSHTVGSRLNQKAVHGVAQSFGSHLRHILYPTSWNKELRQELDPQSSNRLFNLICKAEGPDYCACACSSQGCTPFLAILKEVMREMTGDPFSRTNTRKLFKFPSRLHKVFPQELLEEPEISQAVIRYLTFSALRIRHTCCYCYCELRDNSFNAPYDEEELEELRQEDRLLIDLLGELVEEFETEYFVSDDNFIDFLEGYWKDRMKGVLSDMNESKATEEQKRKLAEIGVNMYEEVKEPRVVEVEEEEEERDLGYWIKRMDEIVA